MYLKELKINGFKSFADPVRLGFTPGICAIVGPNGSGKSNITDAIRFVLGEQSTKSLRSQKMDDIIFSGTGAVAAKGAAEVSLVLSEDGEIPERHIRRKLYRSGESVFRINEKNVRLRDIQEIFRDTGLGKNGYSMVSQGGIENIVCASPQELRVIVEEACGIAGYKLRKQESERKLERTRENLDRVRDILLEIEKQLGPMEKQADKAREYLVLYDRLRCVELLLHAEESRERKEKLTALESSLGACNFSLLSLKKENEARDKKYLSLRSEQDAARGQEDDLKTRLESLDDQVRTLEHERIRDEKDLEHAGDELRRLEDEIRDQTASIGTLEESFDKLGEHLNDSQKNLEDLNRNAEAAQQERDHLGEKLEVLLAGAREKALEKDRLQQKREALSERLLTEKTKEAEQAAVIRNLSETCEKLRKQLAEDEKQKGQLESEAEEAREAYRKLCLEQDRSRKAIEPARAELSALQEAYQKEKAAGSVLRGKLDYERQMEENLAPYSQAVRLIVRKQDPDVIGPVGRLVEIPEKYETAIQTALGAKVQNVVVRDEACAGRLISELKKKRAGRATFLPLDSVKPKGLSDQERQILKTLDGFEGMASDLVEHDKLITPVIENLLGRVIVARDFGSAGAFRRKLPSLTIVTLEGEIFYPGGAIVGGSTQSGKNIFSGKSRIRALEEELKASTEKLKTIEADGQEARVRLVKLSEAMNAGKGPLDACEKDLWEKDKRLDTFRDAHHQAAQSLRENRKKLEERSEAFDEHRATLMELEDEIEKLLNVPDETVDSGDEQELRDQIAKADEKLTAIRVEIARCQGSCDNIKTQLGQISARKTEAETQLESLKSSKEKTIEVQARLTGKMSGGSEQIAELRKQRESLEADRQTLTGRRDEIQKKLDEIDSQMKAVHARQIELSDERARLEGRVEKITEEQKSREKRIFDLYEMNTAMIERDRAQLEAQGEEITDLNRNALSQKVRSLGMVDTSAIETYRETKERYETLKERHDDLIQAESKIITVIGELEHSMEDQFSERFEKIDHAFSDIFSKLFEGGTARLSYTDPEHILTSGIELSAQPPGKNLRHISLLSGGEKAMTAISLLMAFIRINPAPFVIIDEIDAALDDANILRFTGYLSQIQEDNQFIIITHRKTTLRICERIYGVSMGRDGVSRLIAVDRQDYLDEKETA